MDSCLLQPAELTATLNPEVENCTKDRRILRCKCAQEENHPRASLGWDSTRLQPRSLLGCRQRSTTAFADEKTHCIGVFVLGDKAWWLSGVLRAAQDVKIAQLQTTALDTLAAVLKATSGGMGLPSEQRAAIREQLSVMIAEHRSSAVKARAIDIKALLNDGNSPDAPMNDAAAL